MRKNAEWNLFGVVDEARRVAKSEAARVGVTLGKWVEGAIFARVARERKQEEELRRRLQANEIAIVEVKEV